MFSDRKNKNLPLFFFLILSFVLLLFDRLGFLKSARGFFETRLVIPLKSKFFLTNKSKISPDVKSCQDKEVEILNLKSQIASLKEENLAARKLLGAPLPSNWQFSLAKVVSSGEDEMLIADAEEKVIKVGAGVIAQGVLLGEIESLISRVAKVRLISSPESRTVIKIIDKENFTLVGKGLLQGRGGGKMIAREILAEEEIKIGDLVVASVETVDLPVGEIMLVSYNKGDVFKTAEVKRILNPRSLETVFLIKGKI